MPRLFSVFGGNSILDIQQRKKRQIHDDIRNAESDEILEKDEEEYLSELIAQYSFDLPELDFENQDGVKRTKNNRDVLVVRIPFQGEKQQLHWNPQSSRVAYYDGYIEDGYLCFDISRDISNLSDEIQKRIDAIRHNFKNLRSGLEEFNENLQNMSSLEREYESRREEVEAQQEELDDLDFPVRDES